jgi:hypothetical protein
VGSDAASHVQRARLRQLEFVSFDSYGTLIDFERAGLAALGPVVARQLGTA